MPRARRSGSSAMRPTRATAPRPLHTATWPAPRFGRASACRPAPSRAHVSIAPPAVSRAGAIRCAGVTTQRRVAGPRWRRARPRTRWARRRPARAAATRATCRASTPWRRRGRPARRGREARAGSSILRMGAGPAARRRPTGGRSRIRGAGYGRTGHAAMGGATGSCQKCDEMPGRRPHLARRGRRRPSDRRAEDAGQTRHATQHAYNLRAGCAVTRLPARCRCAAADARMRWGCAIAPRRPAGQQETRLHE